MPETGFDGEMTEAILTGPRRSRWIFTDFRPPSGKLPLRRNSASIWAFLCVTAFHPGNCYMQCGWCCSGEEEAVPFSAPFASDIKAAFLGDILLGVLQALF